MNIPNPTNPCHVDNLASLALLCAQDFDGPDASLGESLFCYGIAWRDLGNEWLFIYRHPSLPRRFDRCTLAKTTKPLKEWNWVNWDSFLSTLGMTMDEWLALPLTQQVFDLLNHYGPEEIFGSSYWEGFAISE